MPLDAEPVAGGNIKLRDGVAVVVTKDQGDLFDAAPRYVSHFATCPDAEEHRR